MGPMARRVAALVGGAAIVTMVSVTASCAKQEQKAPETSTTTTTTTTSPATPSAPPAVAPTQKSISPTGGNLFSPQVKAPPAPTAVPGDH